MRFFFFILLLFSVSILLGSEPEKDRLAIMDVQDEEKIFDKKTIVKITDYIFTRFDSSRKYLMIKKSSRDEALEIAIDETVQESRKECIDEKCQISMAAQLAANFLINTKINKMYKGVCGLSISKFDVAKRASEGNWPAKFDCTEKGIYEAIDSLNFGGEKKSSNFQVGKIGEAVEDWQIGQGAETIIKFESIPTEAIVLVDGKILCPKTPCSKKLPMGRHEIVFQKENYLPASKVYDVVKGLSVIMELDPDFGWVTVTSNKKTEIVFNGVIIGDTPINKRITNPGEYTVESNSGCFAKIGEKFQLKRGEHKIVELSLQEKESAINVSATDNLGNDLVADVFVDGKNIGEAPETFKIPLCSKELLVKAKDGGIYKQQLSLQENVILGVVAQFSDEKGKQIKNLNYEAIKLSENAKTEMNSLDCSQVTDIDIILKNKITSIKELWTKIDDLTGYQTDSTERDKRQNILSNLRISYDKKREDCKKEKRTAREVMEDFASGKLQAAAAVMVSSYYNNKGQWAGTYKLAKIISKKAQYVNDNRFILHVKYEFECLRNSCPGGNSGTDYRTFTFSRNNENAGWEVVAMGSYMSGGN